MALALRITLAERFKAAPKKIRVTRRRILMPYRPKMIFGSMYSSGTRGRVPSVGRSLA
jgi:hypothetical protein